MMVDNVWLYHFIIPCLCLDNMTPLSNIYIYSPLKHVVLQPPMSDAWPHSDAVYANKDSSTQDQSRYGDPNSMFICEECYKVFDNKFTLAQHIDTKHNRKPVGECAVCNKIFYSDVGLKRHQRTHAGEYRHYCTVCEPKRGFQEKHAYQAHMSNYHNAPKLYECEICQLKCSSKATLGRHLISIHGRKQPKPGQEMSMAALGMHPKPVL